MSQRLLDVHIRHLHPEAAAKIPPGPTTPEQSRGGSNSLLANRATSLNLFDLAHEREAKRQINKAQQSTGTFPSFHSSTGGNILAAMSIDSPDNIDMLRPAEPCVTPIPSGPPLPRTPHKSLKPRRHLGSVSRPFLVVYEPEGYHETLRMKVPSNEPYEAFLDRMSQVSAPVAVSFIADRVTGFTMDDGPWKYSLVSKELGTVKAGAALTSNIMYQAMISELLKAYSPWSWAIVWHDVQKGPDLKQRKLDKPKMVLFKSSRSMKLNTRFDFSTPAGGLSATSIDPHTPSVIVPFSPINVSSPSDTTSAPSSDDISASSVTVPAYAGQPLPEDPFSGGALDMRSRQFPPRLPPLQPLSELRSRVVPRAVAGSKHGRERPPARLPLSRVVPTTAMQGHKRRRLSLQPLARQPARTSTASRPLSRNSGSSSSLSSLSPLSPHSPTIPPHPHPHHQSFPAPPPSPARTPIQVIARRTVFGRQTFLVQWLEPNVPDSWHPDAWMRDRGWGWMVDDYIRTERQR
ncbi:hypothetical protein MMC07_008232 [Pseudocyphellaria aurata]|nr:hypothetical protein [Pseudocyphellaria aurata]